VITIAVRREYDMPKLRPVTLDDLPLAPVTIRVDARISAPRQRAFDLFSEDPARWGEFHSALDGKGRWLSRTPEGVGSVRRIGSGPVDVIETILAHDNGKRWAFRVDESTLPMAKAMLEDYVFEDAPGGCLLIWTAGIWPIGPAALARPVLTLALGSMIRQLAAGVGRVAARDQEVR
jgi:hypothetical protein